MTEQDMSELDKLACEAYLADCQEQGILVETEWSNLDTLTQDRYRAIAHYFTDGWMSATQLESSLIIEMASVGVEIKRHEGEATTAMHYTWRVNALGLEGDAEMFEFALRDVAATLIRQLRGEYSHPEQRSTGQLLHESGEDPHLFLEPDTNLP